MNKIVLAATVLALSAGVAFAENPNLGTDNHMVASQSRIDNTATATIKASTGNPAANRFGDASPANGQ
jgi:hypothetical protein